MSGHPSVPRRTRLSLFVYNLFFPLVFLGLLPGFALRMLRRGNFRENFGQRLGLYSDADRARFERAGTRIWIHSISVGETLVALKLARELYALDRSVRVALSVTTSTGFALACQAPEDWLVVFYNPIDLRSIVAETLDSIRPVRVLFIEGEAWPNLLLECRLRSIPTALINARLSPRSERRFRKFRALTAPIFSMLDRICVPELEDIARWESLGVERSKITHTGSIKFDLGAPGRLDSSPSSPRTESPRVAEFRALLEPLGVHSQTPILLAGSTWAPEERVLVSVFAELRREFPGLFLILVPRHVERTAGLLRELTRDQLCEEALPDPSHSLEEPLGAIETALPAGQGTAPLRLRRRSTLLPLGVPAPCDILLVDTTGELRHWYELASVVFVGKSLPGVSEIGGQNPAEPAALGKPVLFGPHMENFAPVVGLLLAREAALQIEDPAALKTALRALLLDAGLGQNMGKRAQSALAIHQGATARVAALFVEA